MKYVIIFPLLYTILDTSTQYSRKMVQNTKSVLKLIKKMECSLQHNFPIVFIHKNKPNECLYQTTGTIISTYTSEMNCNSSQYILWGITVHFLFFLSQKFLKWRYQGPYYPMQRMIPTFCLSMKGKGKWWYPWWWPKHMKQQWQHLLRPLYSMN